MIMSESITNKQRVKRRISDYLLGVTTISTLLFAYLWFTHQCGDCGEGNENQNNISAANIEGKESDQENFTEAEITEENAKGSESITEIETQEKPEEVIEETLSQHAKKANNPEEDLWALANKNKTLYSYNRYLKKYPDGKYKKQAEQGVKDYNKANLKPKDEAALKSPNRQKIDTEVLAIFNKTKNRLPPMKGKMPAGGKPGSISNINIKNDTKYALTLLYSGKESKKVVIPPNQSKKFTLMNGPYRVAAKVSKETVGNFVKTETLKGLNYSSIFYIEE